jgi:hypothetical protein
LTRADLAINVHHCPRSAVKTDPLLETIDPADLPRDRQQRLYTDIAAILDKAIDERSPRHRPPGKAGLRAEKGYYRLLYLKGEFENTRNRTAPVDSNGPVADWAHLTVLVRQLKDIPELQAQVKAGIDAAVEALLTGAPGT